MAVANEVHADLIVVGNKGMTGAKRFFLNPVPEKVVDLADRDVLVARTIAQVASGVGPGREASWYRRESGWPPSWMRTVSCT